MTRGLTEFCTCADCRGLMEGMQCVAKSQVCCSQGSKNGFWIPACIIDRMLNNHRLGPCTDLQEDAKLRKPVPSVNWLIG